MSGKDSFTSSNPPQQQAPFMLGPDVDLVLLTQNPEDLSPSGGATAPSMAAPRDGLSASLGSITPSASHCAAGGGSTLTAASGQPSSSISPQLAGGASVPSPAALLVGVHAASRSETPLASFCAASGGTASAPRVSNSSAQPTEPPQLAGGASAPSPAALLVGGLATSRSETPLVSSRAASGGTANVPRVSSSSAQPTQRVPDGVVEGTDDEIATAPVLRVSPPLLPGAPHDASARAEASRDRATAGTSGSPLASPGDAPAAPGDSSVAEALLALPSPREGPSLRPDADAAQPAEVVAGLTPSDRVVLNLICSSGETPSPDILAWFLNQPDVSERVKSRLRGLQNPASGDDSAVAPGAPDVSSATLSCAVPTSVSVCQLNPSPHENFINAPSLGCHRRTQHAARCPCL